MVMEINIPKGYKKTDVGVVPQDWEVYYLYEITKKITDGEHATPKRTTEGYYLLSARNVHNGLIDLTDVDFVGTDEYQRIRKRCDPEANDILISCSGTIGRVAVLPYGIECVMVRSAALIKPNINKINSYFVQYILQSRVGQTQFLQSLNQGAQANLFLNHIERLKIPLPPLPEQKAIAQSLSDTDALITECDRLITKKRHIKQGTMQQLLTGKKRLPGFSGEWKVKKLGEIFDFKNGLNKEKKYFGVGTPIVNYMDVYKNRGLTARDLNGKVTVTEKELKGYQVHKDDVFFTRTSETIDEIGISSVILEDLENTVFSGFVLRARPKNNCMNTFYKKYCFSSQSVRSEITSKSSYTTRALTNGKLLSQVQILLPPTIEEQKAIAQILSDMDAEIAALEQTRNKYQALKQGMMQELLTGKTRLIDSDRI